MDAFIARINAGEFSTKHIAYPQLKYDHTAITEYQLSHMRKQHREDVKEYIRQLACIHNNFKREVLTEVGLLLHPKANEIYNYVWDKTHAFGDWKEQIYYILCELKELFAPMK